MEAAEQGAWEVVRVLERAGHEAYLVGGCVRDRLLGRAVYDYDITTSARPEAVMELFPETVPTGIKHGTVSVLLPEGRYEVTTFRTDGKYEDGRRPEEVVFVRSLTEDLARRDFTINAMALGADGVVRDPFGGQGDLQARCIRAVGDPALRFAEDALRMLRGIRFAAQLRFQIEPQTLQAITYEAGLLRQIARERIRDEWQKMLLSSPDLALPLLRETDLLRHILPRPQTFDLQVNDPWGRGRDPWELAAEWASRAPVDLPLRYAIVFTAIQLDEPRVTKAMAELRLSTQLKQRIKATLRFTTENPLHWSDVDWRQRFFQHGPDAVWRGCCLYAVLHAPDHLESLQSTVETRAKHQPLWSLQDLALTGQDLLTAGIPAGPAIGRLQQRLAQWVLHNPARNEREVLLAQARTWMDSESG